MLLLAKLCGILVMIWFYMTGKKAGEQGIKWAIIGLFGYWISWWLSNYLILNPLEKQFTQSSALVFLTTQIPVVFGLAAAYYVRAKLIKDIESKNSANVDSE